MNPRRKCVVGFYSRLFEMKKWAKCPIWTDVYGNRHTICMVLQSDLKWLPSCISFYKKRYPDLIIIPDLISVHRSGVRDKDARGLN